MVNRPAEIAPDLSAKVESLPELVDGTPGLVHRGRYTSVEFLIEIGTTPYHVTVTSGKVEITRGPVLMRSWSFAIRGGEQAWRQFWRPFPLPGFHDIFALAKQQEFRIEGDFRPLMTNLLYFKAVLAAPRRLAKESA